jgi:uncharacterized protein
MSDDPPDVATLIDMYAPEELHDDLKPYIVPMAYGWQALKHPLTFHVPYSEHLNKLANQSYLYKKAKTDEILRAAGPSFTEVCRFVMLHERPYRFQAFAEIQDRLSDADYWKLLGDVWTDTENLWQNHYLVRSLLASTRPHRECMMNKDEQRLLASLPEEFTVFRGHQRVNRISYSWSLSYGKAVWFANRWSHKSTGVVKAQVRKSDAIAVLTGRNEFEVVIHPDDLTNVQTVAKIRRSDHRKALLTEVVAQFRLPIQGSVHGPIHWDKVERNAVALCKVVRGADTTVCRLFAILHDSQRDDEMDDPEHGQRAADYVRSLGHDRLKIMPAQLDALCLACEGHEKGGVSTDPTIGVCWDADRLDLSRVGVVPDPTLLSTEAARQRIWRI